MESWGKIIPLSRYLYRDTSVLLITDMKGGFRTPDKSKKYGRDIYLIMMDAETTIGGIAVNGLYWKERKMDEVYFSYQFKFLICKNIILTENI